MLTAELTHPIFRIAQEAVTVENDRYVLSPEGTQALRQALLRHAGDPTLVNGVQAVIELAHRIYAHPDSQDTAAQLLNVVVRLRPYLTAICRIPTTDRPIRRLGGPAPKPQRRTKARVFPMRVGGRPYAQA